MSESPAAVPGLQETDSVEAEVSAEPEESEGLEETVESSEAEDRPTEETASETAPETASGRPSADSAVSTGDVRPSQAPVSDGDADTSDITVSGGDAVRPKDTISNTNNALADYPELEELLIDLQEIEAAQLDSMIRIEAQNEAVISILLIILVVGLLHYIYRFLKMFF